MRNLSLAFLLACAFFTSGCVQTDSTGYDITEISVTYAVQIKANAAVVSAVFWKRGEDVVLLLGQGDAISVNGTLLAPVRGEFYDYYTAEIAPDAAYTFSLARGDGMVYEGNVIAPAAPALLAPASGGQLSRAEGFVMAWEGAGPAKVSVNITGEHLTGLTKEVLDTGECTIGPGEVTVTADAPGPSLPALLTATRTLLGVLDPVMDGVVSATSEDSLPFTSIP